MPELATILEELRFLRPWWLLMLLATLVLGFVLARGASAERQWRRMIAPHLLAHLKVGTGQGRRFRPLHLVMAVLVLGSVALAGPTWEREISPLAEDTAPLVIALDLSISMNALDVQPTRLERAKQKARDLLTRRAGAKSALIAYAGSAHTVLPLCDDASLFEAYLAALESTVMPVKGKDAARALALAAELLHDDSTPGSILFLTDGIAEEHIPPFIDHAATSDDAVLVLAVGTREGGSIRKGDGSFETDATGRRVKALLDVEGFEALESRAGAFVAGVTVDDADVGRIERRIQSHLRQVRQQDETARWKDQGYWLTFPIAVLALLWFRKGWTVRWSSALMVGFILGGCSTDLWWTPDQQGRRSFERGDYGAAAESFEEPMWKAVSHYRAGHFEQAAETFGRLGTTASSFNLGNSYAMLGRYEEAVAAYEAALAERPEWVEATANRDAVQALIALHPEPPEEDQGSAEPSFDPDEIRFDKQGKKGKLGEVEASQLTDEQLAEMWLRRLRTSPTDFLRRRFAIEAAEDDTEAER